MTDQGAGIPPVLMALPGAVVPLTADGVVLSSNGKLERALRGEVVGQKFEQLLDPNSSIGKWRRVSESAGSAEAVRCELVLVLGAGLTDPIGFFIVREAEDCGLWVIEITEDPRLGRLNDEVHTMNATLNATQRELSKEKRRLDRVLGELQDRQFELARSNRDLQQFAHVISHDLKAPLRNVRSYAEFLRQDLAGTLPEEAEGFLQRIITRSSDMDAMIDGVLRYARAGQSSSPTEPVDVGALVRELVDLHDVAADTSIHIAPHLPVIEANKTQLRQVLQNLIANALKYGRGAPPVLEISSSDAGEFIDLRVADNGPGISAEDQERIWNLFYTTTAIEEDGSGSGIGLALVKRLVDRNGGVITVESGEGKGAAFTVRWPKVPVRPAQIQDDG